VDTVVVDSSGNAGASMAAYASAAGLRCRVYAPRSAPLYKKLQIAAYGAELVEAESREAASLVAQSCEQGFYAGHLWNPLFIEGCMTLAFEVFEEQGCRTRWLYLWAAGHSSWACTRGLGSSRRPGSPATSRGSTPCRRRAMRPARWEVITPL